MNADDISKLIKRIFAGIVAVIVAIGQVISGRRSVEEEGGSVKRVETREERRERKKAERLKQGAKKKGKKQGKKREERLSLENKSSSGKDKA